MSRYLLIFAFVGIFWHAAASAMTVGASEPSIWQPTDSNTNYASLGHAGASTISFALFDYDEDSQTVDHGARLQFSSGDQISFFAQNGQLFAMNDSNPASSTLPLGSSYWFAIGASDGCVWVFDDGAPTPFGTNMYALTFQFRDGSNAVLLQVDAQIASIVPVPVPALLLASGFAVLVGTGACSRRRPA